MIHRNTLLIVDDVEINRAILHSLFEKSYNILEAENGKQALMLLNHYKENIAAMLLDLTMPIMNGYQVMDEMSRQHIISQVPVVIITSDDSTENEVRAFDLGASDIIMKPFEPHVVKRRVENIIQLNLHKLHLEELVSEQALKLRESNEVIVDALSSVIEYRSLESGQHIKRIRLFTKILLEEAAINCPEYDLNEDRIRLIVDASSMHDIGKIAIPDSILNKPGALTAEEFEIMKTHTTKGCEILSGLDRMDAQEYLLHAYNICRYHHERWDGRGYPDGLKGENIPISAQVVAIADCYDALTNDRVYKKAFSHEKAFNMILNGECGTFSPKILECFKNVRNQFADLAAKYADGKPAVIERPKNHTPSHFMENSEFDILKDGHAKYFALLKYVNAAVIEADMDTGVYHLIFTPDKNFEALRSGDSFKDSAKSFINSSVHPDDRKMITELLDNELSSFFNDGLPRFTCSCRILDHTSMKYIECRVSILRLNSYDPKQHKFIMILDTNVSSRKYPTDTVSEYDPAASISCTMTRRNDNQMSIIHANEAFYDLLGYSEQEISDKFNDDYIEMVAINDRESIKKEIDDQLISGNFIEIQYRIITKSGKIIWILEKSHAVCGKNGEEYIYCILTDITPLKSVQADLYSQITKYETIINQTNDIIVEWDMNADTLTFSKNWSKRFAYEPITKNISDSVMRTSHIHPDDLSALRTMIANIKNGKLYYEIEMRLTENDGKYRWYKIRSTTQFDKNKKPYKAIGVIMDIDNDKKPES